MLRCTTQTTGRTSEALREDTAWLETSRIPVDMVLCLSPAFAVTVNARCGM